MSDFKDRAASYETSIFFNCPFDREYQQIFAALIFATYDCGYRPRCALELDDGGQVRVEKIIKMIESCRLGVHDISRTELDREHQLPRFNMPFELGLFVGAARFGTKAQTSKISLILDRERYRFQKFISDIAGQDIAAHKDEPKNAIKALRTWLASIPSAQPLPGGASVAKRYQAFQGQLPGILKKVELEPDAAKNGAMSQALELTRVKARIKALTEKTVAHGCTEAEAMSAAEMVGRLLERYALSMDEIEIRSSRCVQREVPLGGKRRRPIDGCVPSVARFCDCKVWLAHATDEKGTGAEETARGKRYVFFGFETDADLATYLFSVIDRAVTTETDNFKLAHPRLRAVRLRQGKASFQHGLVARVAARLGAMHEEREASVEAQRSAGKALILAKHQVVDDAFRETKVRLVSMSAVGAQLDGKAYREGWAAGEKVNLSRPVKGEGRDLLR